jgi:hypothetical protein
MYGWHFLDAFTKIKTDKTISIHIVTSTLDPADALKSNEYRNEIVKPIILPEAL